MTKASKSQRPPSLEPALSRSRFRRLQPQAAFQAELDAFSLSRLSVRGPSTSNSSISARRLRGRPPIQLRLTAPRVPAQIVRSVPGTPAACSLRMPAPSTTYEPQHPAQGPLYQIVHDYFETFRAQAASLRGERPLATSRV